MSNRFQRGLVVGKFSPLHRGHELVINRALKECDEVVLLSYSNPELPDCDATRRERWLKKLFPNATSLVLTDDRLKAVVDPGDGPREVPHNDADELTHRRFCGHVCQKMLGVTVDAVFTSEDYGDGFAAELTRLFRKDNPALPDVKHVMVDRHRSALPISGTQLRKDVHGCRGWLSPVVYASFVQRVCLLGGESAGKSTLAAALGRSFATVHVTEYGRDLWEAKSGKLAFEDMRHIAEVQTQREDDALLRANRFVFCDTSPLTTLFYSHHLFGKTEPVLEVLAKRSYDHTILCAPDFEFVQDGTRQPATFRLWQHGWYLSELGRRQIPFLLVTGTVESRLNQIRDLLA